MAGEGRGGRGELTLSVGQLWVYGADVMMLLKWN